MNYILSNISKALYDDDTFYTIVETDYNKGFIRVKQLSSGKEFKIAVTGNWDCCDCELWQQGRDDGTCIHYINNDCPCGYHE